MAKPTPSPSAFDRDLGYLDKFLATLRQHAEGLEEGVRDELLKLLTEEEERWVRLRELLGASPGPQTTPPAPEPAKAPPRPTPAPQGLTVGSLFGR